LASQAKTQAKTIERFVSSGGRRWVGGDKASITRPTQFGEILYFHSFLSLFYAK
jgi:hypothetical protein